MTAELLWKEYREQRSIWLALALVSLGSLVGLPLAYQPEPSQQAAFLDLLRVIAVVLAWTYGMVCGAMLLAGEREAGTQAFLDTLPTGRLPLWLGKALAGGLFLALQLAVLGFVAGVQGLFMEQYRVVGALLLIALGLSGYGWGLFFSAVQSSVLGAIGMTILAHAVLLPVLNLVLLVVMTLLSVVLHDQRLSELAVVPAGLLWLVLPWPLSALIFSRTDFQRHPLRLRRRAPVALAAPVQGWDRLCWLCWRQTRGLAPGLLAFCLAAGLPVVAAGLFFWPVLTLGVGAFCGVTVFFDEQSGAYRFLGEQRFPLGRLWLVKVGMRLALLLVALLVMLLPSLLAQLVFQSRNPGERGESQLLTFFGPIEGKSAVLFLGLWAAYGFAVGLVCGLLFRKPLVALVVTVGVGMLLVGIWAPSLVGGGLHSLQVAGVPLVLLVAGFFLMRPWAQDRLVSLDVGLLVTTIVILCASLTLLGLWLRIAEVPEVAEPADFPAFVAGLPTPEKNEGGRLTRSACSRVEELSKQWRMKRANQPLLPGDGPAPLTDETLQGQAGEVLRRGWPDGVPWLAGALDEVFAEDWWKRLAEAARKPVGVVEDPRELTVLSPMRTLEPARLAGMLLPARALQLQKMKNDPAAFVDHLAISLALVRNMQNQAPWPPASLAAAIEGMQMRALDRWLEQLDGRHDLLARVAALLAEQEESLPVDDHEQKLADYLIALNSLDRLGEWLPSSLPSPGSDRQIPVAALVEGAWRLPWEEARNRRIVRAMHWGPGTLGMDSPHSRLLWNLGAMDWRRSGGGQHRHHLRAADFAARELMVALRRFEAENGKPAERLAQLVPKYLERIPSDPFDGKAFRYRLSKGEMIVWPDDDLAGGAARQGAAAEQGGAAPAPPPAPPEAPGMADGPPGPMENLRTVPAGQGILWSVGVDGEDNGGKRHRTNRSPGRFGDDLIYLVPLPRKNRH
jgi:hypothetical protein